MVHFALIQIAKKHTEILGTFIEIILKNNWDLTIFYNVDADEYNFVNFYSNLFSKQITIKNTSQIIMEADNIDFFIYGSSTDDRRMPDIFKNTDLALRTIYVHHQAEHLKSYMLKSITVSPVIKSNDLQASIYECILPIYKSYKKLHWKPEKDKKTTIFAVIGGIRTLSNGKLFDKNLELVFELLNNHPDGDYEFWFFMRKWDWIWICKKYKILENHPKILGFPGLKTEIMIKSLHRAKFILPLAKKKGWFYWQRLTGTIPLAINLNIPMIMDRELAEIYRMENYSLCYENSLLEIYDKVIEMKDDDYYKWVENSVKYKAKICKENEKKLISLCLKQVSPNIRKNYPQISSN